MPNLTNNLVADLPYTTTGQRIVRDSKQRGFFVTIGTTSKAYTFQVDVRRLGKRKTVRETIGRVEDWDCGQARNEAMARIGALKTGAATTAPRQAGVTLGQAWSAYRDLVAQKVAAGQMSAKTLGSYTYCIENLLADWLDTPLRELSETDKAADLLAERHREITRTKRGKGGGAYAANRALKTLRTIYNFAVDTRMEQGLPSTLPFGKIAFNKEGRKSTGMAKGDLAAWYRELRALPNPIRRELHLFLLLSGSRPDALRRARWADLDKAKRLLHFPDPKGGGEKAFDMPLSGPMLECLERALAAGQMIHGRQAQEYIFPAASAAGCIVETKEYRRNLSKWGSDLRQTYATACRLVKLSEMDTRILMNHALTGVSAGYVTVDALEEEGHLLAQQEKVSAYIVEGLEK